MKEGKSGRRGGRLKAGAKKVAVAKLQKKIALKV